jgi:hypothetical protein
VWSLCALLLDVQPRAPRVAPDSWLALVSHARCSVNAQAEDFARHRQYEYGQNSNLVLEADRESRRRSDEATGEVESLWGKLGSKKMGDRVQQTKPKELQDKLQKMRKKCVLAARRWPCVLMLTRPVPSHQAHTERRGRRKRLKEKEE